MVIIDASDLILGRLATRVAKLALAGQEVTVLNCDKVIISGKQSVVLKKFKEREARTQPFKGPFRKRMPDRIVRSAIRGMLPHRRWSEGSRGRVALEKVKCYIGVPDEFKAQKAETIEGISSNELKTQHYVTVGKISQLLKQD